MAIAKKPTRSLTDVVKPDPMAFIQGAEHSQTDPIAHTNPKPLERKRKEPVIIRFDEHTLEQVDRAAAKRGLSRAALAHAGHRKPA